MRRRFAVFLNWRMSSAQSFFVCDFLSRSSTAARFDENHRMAA